MSRPHITGISRALFRIFVQPSLKVAKPRNLLHIRRQFAPIQLVRFGSKYADHSKSNHLKLSSHPVNEDICKLEKLVQLVNADGGLQEPIPLGQVLRRVNRPEYHVVQFKGLDISEAGGFPLVKILSETELIEIARRQIRREQQRKDNEKRNEAKIVELSWAIGENDLAHRIKMVKDFLHDGLKVEVALSGRRGMVPMGLPAREELVQRIKESLGDVEGLREYRQMDGKMERSVTVFFDSPAIAKVVAKNEKDAGKDTKDTDGEESKKPSGYQARMEKRKALEQQELERQQREEQSERPRRQERRSRAYGGTSHRDQSGLRRHQSQRW